MALISQFVTDPRFSFETALDTLTVQEIVNELRLTESSFTAMSHPFLLDATGKQSLSGGQFVGITYQGKNHEIAFASERVPVHVGSITTPDSTIEPRIIPSIDVIDSTATFIADGVVAGSPVINFTDHSIADVIEVISETTLRVTVPVNGSDNVYDMSDVIHVFNIVTKRVLGGNTTAVDEFDVSIDPIHGTFGVLALVEQSTSAALLNPEVLDDIHGQLQRSIFIDTSAATNGNGYQQTPYNNFTDAVDDAEANNIFSLVLLADATVDRQLRNFVFTGIGSPTLDFNGQDVDKSEFYNLELDAEMVAATGIIVEDCTLRHNSSGYNGKFYRCGFGGDLTLRTASTILMIDCWSSIGGLSRPTIDTNGGVSNISIRSYRGGLTVSGITDVSAGVTVSMAQGKLTLDASNTAGVISVRGTAQFTDSSTGSTVDKSALIQPNKLLTIAKFIGLK